MLKTFLLLTVLGTKSIYAQFLEQPPAENVFSPVNVRVTFSCSVNVSYGIDWEVRINNGEPIYAALRIHEVAFMRHNFTFTGVATRTSSISFGILNETGSQTNNDTTITCIAQEGVTARKRGNEVRVYFYGAPPPPIDLNVTEVELGSFNISWSLEFIEGVPVNYTLTVLNLNTTSAQPIIIAGLLDQHYVFETSRPCDVYSFTITAVTAAGNSTPSQESNFSRNSNDMCLDTTTPTPVPTTGAITTNGSTRGSTGVSGGATAGIVIGVAIIVIGIIITITVVFTCPFQAPRGIGFTSTHNTINVTWNHRLCIRYYDVKIEDGDVIRIPTNSRNFDHRRPGTTYKIYVSEANEFFCGPFAVIEATTEQTEPIKPQNMELDSTSDSIIARWDPIPFDNQYGDISHYVIKIKDEHGNNIQDGVWNVNANHKFVNLDPCTTYNIHVAGANRIGIGDFAEGEVTTNPRRLTMEPENIELVSTSDSIIARWDPIPPSNEHGEITHYVIRITDEHGNNIRNEDLNVVNHTFMNLDPYTKYKISVAGANSIGNGPFADREVTTEPTKPTMEPQNIELVPTFDSINAKWDHLLPNNQYGDITHYVIKITDEHGNNIIGNEERNVYVNHYTFNSLDPCKKYKIHVAGANKVGNGPFFIIEVATTEQTVGLSECEWSIGLTSTEEEILVLDEKNGIRIFKDLKQTQLIRLEEEHMTEITVDKKAKNIYVTTAQTCKVLKLDMLNPNNQESVSLKSIDPDLKFLNGLCINNDKLWVCDTNADKILILDLNLHYCNTITGNENGGNRFQSPRDVEFDQQGNVYIAERTGIQVLSQDYSPVRIIGEGRLRDTAALKIVKETIFAVHSEGVELFSTSSGDHIKKIYKNDEQHIGLHGIAVGKNDDVYVSTPKGNMLTFHPPY